MDKSSMMVAEIKSGGVNAIYGKRTLYPVAKINNYRSEKGTKTSKRNNG